MKLALFSPYGSFHQEGGLLYLVANYIDKQGGDVVQLRCDGALPACGRDKKHPNGRTPFSCLQCMGEQRALSHWAGVKSRDLSSFIIPDDAQKSTQWISSVTREDLGRVEFRGVRLWDVCEQEIADRWELDSLATITPGQRDLRTLYVAYVHTVVSSERFISTFKPTVSFVVSSTDPLSQAYLSQLKKAGAEAAIFSYEQETESIIVEALSNGERYATPLVLADVTEMRADPRTWAPELTAIVNEMLTFLGHGADLVPGQS